MCRLYKVKKYFKKLKANFCTKCLSSHKKWLLKYVTDWNKFNDEAKSEYNIVFSDCIRQHVDDISEFMILILCTLLEAISMCVAGTITVKKSID